MTRDSDEARVDVEYWGGPKDGIVIGSVPIRALATANPAFRATLPQDGGYYAWDPAELVFRWHQTAPVPVPIRRVPP
jgi:hypothetical protein